MPLESFTQFVLDQLEPLGGIDCRRMFGGAGLYYEGVFFAIVHCGRLYFKTDETTRPAYESQRMGPFRPNARQTLKTYYEVPADVIEDCDALAEWARRAVSCRR
jgi:DNA transformation protein